MSAVALTPEQVQDVARAVNEVVAYYAAHVRTLDERDIAQMAWVAALETLGAGTWSPERGPLTPYVARAIRRQVGTRVVRELAPVSASRRLVYALYGIRSEALGAVYECDAPASRGTEDHDADRAGVEASEHRPAGADEILVDQEWEIRVAARLARAVGEEGLDGLVELLDEVQHTGRTCDRITRSRAVACLRIAQDVVLRELLGER